LDEGLRHIFIEKARAAHHYDSRIGEAPLHTVGNEFRAYRKHAGGAFMFRGEPHLVSLSLSKVSRLATWLTSKQPGSIGYVSSHQTRMNSKDNQPISIGWQLAIKVNSHGVTTVNVNLKAIVLKLLGYLLNEGLVWIKRMELVNNGCLSHATGIVARRLATAK